MTVDRAKQEKRDFIRMKIDTPLRAQINGEGIAAEGLCHELSGGGMQVATEHNLSPGTEVEVTISSEHGNTPTLRAKARVVRTQTDAKINRVGLEILEIIH